MAKHNGLMRCMNAECGIQTKAKEKCPRCKLFSIECEYCLRGNCANEKIVQMKIFSLTDE